MSKNNVIHVRGAIFKSAFNLEIVGGPLFKTKEIQDLVEEELGIRPGDEFTSKVLSEKFSLANGLWSRSTLEDD